MRYGSYKFNLLNLFLKSNNIECLSDIHRKNIYKQAFLNYVEDTGIIDDPESFGLCFENKKACARYLFTKNLMRDELSWSFVKEFEQDLQMLIEDNSTVRSIFKNVDNSMKYYFSDYN